MANDSKGRDFVDLLTILEFPDPRLRLKAAPVPHVTSDVTDFCEAMLETMYQAPGIGLAATQVNVQKRILVCDVSEDKSEPLVLINPEIEIAAGDVETQEGCLSVPGFYEPVNRPDTITVTALDRAGEPLSIEAEGMLAVCIQHEIDHLDGRLFVDYLSSTKRQMIRKKLLKLRKQRQ